MTIAGGGLWAYSAATRPVPTEQGASAGAPAGASGAAAGMGQGFLETTSPPTREAPASDARARGDTATGAKRLIDDSAPATFRLGLSFIVGYFLGFGLKKFVKTTILVAGAIATLAVVAERMGLFNIDWGAIQQKASDSLAWARGQAGALRSAITGYLPSAGAAGVGVFVGARKA